MEKKQAVVWWQFAPVLLPLLLFALLQGKDKDPLLLLQWGLILVFGYIAAYFDWLRRIVPNRLVLIMLCVWLLVMLPQLFFRINEIIPFLLNSLIGFLFCGVIFLGVYLISRRGVGGGDIKFMSVAGLYLGARCAMSAMLLGSVLAALVGLTLILLKKIHAKDHIPMIPFLYAGILISVLFL